MQVYGTTLGLARAKHVRAAVKRLHATGGTGCDGRGDVQHMLVSPAAPAALARMADPLAESRATHSHGEVTEIETA